MYQERPLDSSELDEITMFATDARKVVGLDSTIVVTDRVIGALDTFIDFTQKAIKSGARSFSEEETMFLSLQVGCLYGQQVVEGLGWQWCCLVNEGSEFYAVASGDRSLCMLPTYRIRDWIEQPQLDCVAALAFNMVAANCFSHAPPGGLLNVLDNVVRVVPRGSEESVSSVAGPMPTGTKRWWKPW